MAPVDRDDVLSATLTAMTDSIHVAAARGFTAGVEAYERARPTYPPEAVETIVETLGLAPGRTLLELGAGTGKLTRLLAPTGVRLLAVEPVEAMRAKLLDVVPDVELIDGTAEAIALPNASVDAIVVAQAFHWFDAIRALSEMHRVLRPGGRVALVFNRRDESVAWVEGLGEAIRRISAGEPQVWGGEWHDALDWCALFGPWLTERSQQVQRLTHDGVVDRVASVSYVAAATPEVREAVLGEVRALLGSDPLTAGRDEVELPYNTDVLWAPRVSIEPGAVGVVASVNANGGGVPKLPVASAVVGPLGLHNDAHAEPEPIHGGPDQAVCLYAQEAIERVRADGHQAFPGAFGENLTLLGIDWASLTSGDRLVIGDGEAALELELTSPAGPCQTIAHWFVEGRIARISPKVNPEDARWYARVLREGEVAPGMRVQLVRA
jgi:MOSC domain-containing protein YiiM/SAM-dependent methyltransferase